MTEQESIYQDFKKEGFPIIIKCAGSVGTFNPITMQYDNAIDATEYSTYAIKKLVKRIAISDTITNKYDTQIVFPALYLPLLTLQDKLFIDGVDQNIVKYDAIAPLNTLLLFIALIRTNE